MNERNVFGYKVVGEKREGTYMVAQDNPALLINELRNLFTSTGVNHVVWTQYTPYFNDGDVCNFSVGDLEVYGKDDYGYGFEVTRWFPRGREYDYTLCHYVDRPAGDRTYTVEPGYEFNVSTDPNFPHPEFDYDHYAMVIGDRVARMLGSGKHDAFLLEAFGDHTEVKFDGEVFTHDHYSHD